jgi:hypothetical protein
VTRTAESIIYPGGANYLGASGTIMACFRLSQTITASNDGGYLFRITDAGENGWHLMKLAATGGNRLAFRGYDGSSLWAMAAAPDTAADTTYTCTAKWIAGAQSLQVSDGTAATATSATIPNPTAPAIKLAYIAVQSIIAGILIYNRVLSAAEASLNHNWMLAKVGAL